MTTISQITEISDMIFELRGMVMFLCFLNISIGLASVQCIAYLTKKVKKNARSDH